jgi:hypothetical protein
MAVPVPLVFPDPTHLTDDRKTKDLNDLFAAWGDLGIPYKTYFIMTALEDRSVLDDAAGYAERNHGQPTPFYPFQGLNYALNFQYIPQLVSNAASAHIFAPSPDLAVFVLPDVFSAPVPYGVAQQICSSFVCGLMTRLVLERYSSAWAPSAGKKITLNLSPLNADPLGLTQSIKNMSAAFTNPSQWDYHTWPGATVNTTYDEFQRWMTDACGPQASGMFLGWTAGDALYKLAAGTRDTCLQKIWHLFGSQFTAWEIGVAVSYTLNFMMGFVRNERTKKVASGQKPPALGIHQLDQIFGALADQINGDRISEEDDPLAQIAEQFFKMIVGEFYAITGNDQLQPTEKLKALQQYAAFLDGFEYGSLKAADVIFMLVFNTAYTIGYSNGFRDGYSQGYAAGYQAGYTAGYVDGKEAATSLTNILTDVSGFFNSTDGFLKDAVNVGTVIVSIASLF